MARSKKQKEALLRKQVDSLMRIEEQQTYKEWVNFEMLFTETKDGMIKKWDEYYERVRQYWMPITYILKEELFGNKSVVAMQAVATEAQQKAPEFNEPEFLDPREYQNNPSYKQNQIYHSILFKQIQDLCSDLGVEYIDCRKEYEERQKRNEQRRSHV